MRCVCLLLFIVLSLVRSEWVYHYGYKDVDLYDNLPLYANISANVGCQSDTSFTIHNPYTDARTEISILHGHVVVAFKSDVEIASKCNTTLGKSHVGESYLKMYSLLRNPLMYEMRRVGHFPLVAMGHGVSGALAQLFAYDLIQLESSKRVKGVITFDSPATGTEEFSSWLCSQVKCIRVQKSSPNYSNCKVSEKEEYADMLMTEQRIC